MDTKRRFKVQGRDESGDILVLLTDNEGRAKAMFRDMKGDLEEVEMTDANAASVG